MTDKTFRTIDRGFTLLGFLLCSTVTAAAVHLFVRVYQAGGKLEMTAIEAITLFVLVAGGFMSWATNALLMGVALLKGEPLK